LDSTKRCSKARAACARHRYVLKCDVRKYFPSIDHAILKELLERAIKCRPTLDLVSAIIDGSNAQEEVSAVFPGDTLLTPLERRKGLPIGNQTSQFFANVYLNALDHFVLRELRPATIRPIWRGCGGPSWLGWNDCVWNCKRARAACTAAPMA
jgi:retron-type reverse transcriptase